MAVICVLIALFVLGLGSTSGGEGEGHGSGVAEFGSALQPRFVEDNGLAVDPASGDLLVIDSGTLGDNTVSRFKPNGEPDPFSALDTNVIDAKRGTGNRDCTEEPSSCDLAPEDGFVFGDADEVEVAIAPPGSAGGTEGDIYVVNSYAPGTRAIEIFAPDGRYLGQLTKAGATDLGEPCGVAVDASGSVYVADYARNRVFKFRPKANPATDGDHVAGFSGSVARPCTLAAGRGPSRESLFVAGHNPLGNSSSRRPVTKLSSVTGVVELVIGGSVPTTVAVDPASGDVLVAKRNEIDRYTPSGDPAGAPVSLGVLAEGIAVGDDGTVYSSRANDPHVEIYMRQKR